MKELSLRARALRPPDGRRHDIAGTEGAPRGNGGYLLAAVLAESLYPRRGAAAAVPLQREDEAEEDGEHDDYEGDCGVEEEPIGKGRAADAEVQVLEGARANNAKDGRYEGRDEGLDERLEGQREDEGRGQADEVSAEDEVAKLVGREEQAADVDANGRRSRR